jgi:ATP-dependent DNA helicase RecQ
MLMSCVFRVKEHSGFAVGLRHLVEVLTGGNTEKIRQWGHETLTTYGIGKEHSRDAWMHFGRELMRKGLIHQDPDQFHTIQLTAEGMRFLKERQTIELTEPLRKSAGEPGSADAAGSEYDAALFDELRALRKKLADEKGVPAYAIFSDVALRQMSAYYPQDLELFGCMSGVGSVKLEAYGRAFIQAIQNFLNGHPKQTFANPPALGSKSKERQQGVSGSVFESLRLFNEGMDLDAIAETRGFKRVTIEQHLAQAVEENLEIRDYAWFTEEEAAAMELAFNELGDERLAPVREHLNQSVSYLQLNIYRAIRRKTVQ